MTKIDETQSDNPLRRTRLLLMGNPWLVAPPLVSLAVQAAVFVCLAALFLDGVVPAVRRLASSDIQSVLAVAPDVAAHFLSGAARFFLLFLLIRAAIGWINAAGWGMMMSRAAATGETGASDYLEGVGAFLPRVAFASVLRSCVLALPFLLLISGWQAAGALELDGSAFGFLFVLVPLAFLVDIVLYMALWMWKPSCFIDNVSVIEAFRRGAAYTFHRPGRALTGFVLWGTLAGMVVSAALVGWVLLAVILPESQAVAIGAAIAVAVFGALFAIGAGFHQYFYVMYQKDAIKTDSPIAPANPRKCP